jgi:tripartite-type tricarboxylate transporter receptor subunit TctC
MDVYRAKPDGYLLLLNLFPRNAQLEVSYKTGFKILDMAYLPAFVKSWQVVTVRNDSPYKSFKELVEAAKKKTLSCSVSGAGSNAHLLSEMMRRRLGLNINSVPFKGTVPAMTALLGGNVDLTTVDDLQVMLHKDKVRPLAISANERHRNFPALPTIKELGYDVPAVETRRPRRPPTCPKMSKESCQTRYQSYQNPEFISGMEKTGTNPAVVSGPEFHSVAQAYYKLAVEYKDILTEQK